MPPIRILIVADGIFNFIPSDPSDGDFTLTFLVQTLRNSVSPVHLVETAHRFGNPYATIKDPFNFATSVPDLGVYDEIWLFGYSGSNGSSSDNLIFITEDELVALAIFMDNGGGVMAAGDHDGLGSLMCGKIPRVRSMRKWFHSEDQDASIGAAPRNYPAAGPNRADTLVMDKKKEFHFDNQSDDLPQQLVFPEGTVHTLLQGSNGPINYFPDHMHEGEVLGYNGIPGRVPWTLDDSLTFAGQQFIEYPIANGYQETPQVIATGKVTGGHQTLFEDGSSNCEQANFDPDSEPTIANEINILSTYDGHNVGVGRVVTDSSFHHYLDLNITGDPCGFNEKTLGFRTTAGQPYLTGMKDFFLNLASWLAGPRVQTLASLVPDGVNPLIFYIHGDQRITEATWTPSRWLQNPIKPNRPVFRPAHFAKTVLPCNPVHEGSTLASVMVHATEYRVYYIDRNSHINELAWTSGQWINNVLPSNRAIENSPITCLAINGADSRVYYFDYQNHLNELAWVGDHWVNTLLAANPARSASPMTSFALKGTDSRVYYVDTQGRVNEQAWVGHWVNNVLPSKPVLGDSGLTCFGANGTDSRIYYMDNFRRINELVWVGNDWANAVISSIAGNATTGQYGGGMACFGLGGTDPRIYYTDEEVQVRELKWNSEGAGSWTETVLPGGVARRPGAVTCLQLGDGVGVRVYYLDENERVNESRWDGSLWTRRVV